MEDQRKRQMNWLTLAFPETLEREFRSDYIRASLFQVRIALALGIFLYCFFGLLDAWFIPEAKLQLWFIRYAVALPCAIAVLITTYTRLFETYMQPLMAALVAVAGIGIVAMTVIAPPGAGYAYYVGLIVTLIYGYTFTRLRFIWASVTGWVIVISYEIAAVSLTDTPMAVLIGNNFFFLSSNILLMFASYSAEYNLRRDYLQTRMLEAEKRKVVEGSATLERRTRELEMEKDRAERASRAKSEFLAHMSHELRTPLNHIIGFTEMVTDERFGTLNSAQQEFLNDVLGSGRHLLSLINDVLDISKVEAGKMELELARVNITALLDSSLVMVREKAMKHGIRLVSDYAPSVRDPALHGEVSDHEVLPVRGEGPNDKSSNHERGQLPGTIQADERKLKQVMYNLLSNAVKFTPDGGEVRLTARLLNRSDAMACSGGRLKRSGGSNDSGEKWLCVSVTDTGIGIRPEDQDRIFAPFEQADSSASRAYDGTGLGLSLTMRFVELHGGVVWVESEGEGRGSRFTFVIPITQLDERKWGTYIK
jgi:signal transduction histidine kinase